MGAGGSEDSARLNILLAVCDQLDGGKLQGSGGDTPTSAVPKSHRIMSKKSAAALAAATEAAAAHAALLLGSPPPLKKAPAPVKSRRHSNALHGPCYHCGVLTSPQWRKGPPHKPILCNACGTRFSRQKCLPSPEHLLKQAARQQLMSLNDDWSDDEAQHEPPRHQVTYVQRGSIAASGQPQYVGEDELPEDLMSKSGGGTYRDEVPSFAAVARKPATKRFRSGEFDDPAGSSKYARGGNSNYGSLEEFTELAAAAAAAVAAASVRGQQPSPAVAAAHAALQPLHAALQALQPTPPRQHHSYGKRGVQQQQQYTSSSQYPEAVNAHVLQSSYDASSYRRATADQWGHRSVNELMARLRQPSPPPAPVAVAPPQQQTLQQQQQTEFEQLLLEQLKPGSLLRRLHEYMQQQEKEAAALQQQQVDMDATAQAFAAKLQPEDRAVLERLVAINRSRVASDDEEPVESHVTLGHKEPAYTLQPPTDGGLGHLRLATLSNDALLRALTPQSAYKAC